MIRAVIDTNVIFEGLTRRNRVGAYIIKLRQAQLVRPYDSLTLQHEYYDVLGSASDTEFDAVLAEGEPTEPESTINPDLAARVEAKIVAARTRKLKS